MNPFKYGDPVEGEYYLERIALKKSTSNFIESGVNVVLIGPRRYGKTSFILDLISGLKQKKYASIFVDIFNVTTHRDFLHQLVGAITHEKTLTKRFWDGVKSLPKHFQPAFDFDPASGKSNFKFSLQAHKLNDDQVKQLIMETLDSLKDFSEKVFIAFDEFQTIGQLQDHGWLEATIRSKMQMQKNVSYLFSGSRHGIIHDMFNNQSRPFYRSCQLIDFPRFGPEFTSWVIQRFAKIGISCAPDIVDYLRYLVDETPNYVQMACFHLVAEEKKTVNRDDIDTVIHRITSQNSYAYQTLLNALTIPQQKVLRLAACEERAVYTKEMLDKYEIKTAANVQQALKSLVKKQIIDESSSKGVVIFDDPLFKIWLKNEFSV